jgi:alpha-amylase
VKRILQTITLGALFLPMGAFAGSMGGPGTYLGNGTDILMQGFTWPSASTANYFNYLSGEIPQIQASGATMVWLPPAAVSDATQGYMPEDWYTQNSAYGTEAQEAALVSGIKAAGMKAIADIVIQHRSGDASTFDFERPNWLAVVCNTIVCQSLTTFGYTPACATCTNDPLPATTLAPNLNHQSTRVEFNAATYASWMMNAIGYNGFRFDECSGYQPQYVQQYDNIAQPYFSVGEDWEDQATIQTWLSGCGYASTAFDFPLKWILNTCMGTEDYSTLNNGTGQLNGLAGSNPANAVTFLDDHDTAYNGSSGNPADQYFPLGKELEGYAVILTHPGTPMIFYGHYFGTVPISTSTDNGTTNLTGVPTAAQIAQEQAAIQALTQVRKAMGINAQSSCDILEAENGLYAAVINGDVAVAVGPDAWTPPASYGIWNLATSGTNYEVWELAGAVVPQPTATPTNTPFPGCGTVQDRVLCGATAPYTDTSGNVWSPDTADVVSGTGFTQAATIAGTANQGLYQQGRYGNPVEDSFNVPNGNYEVTLYLAETDAGDEEPGNRVFNVELNGVTAVAGIDEYTMVGADTALVLTCTASVTAGVLTVAGVAAMDNAQFNSIMITELGSCGTSTSTVTPIPSATASPTPTRTPSSTETATDSPTDTPTASPTATASRTTTPTDSPTETSSATPSDSPSASPTKSATETSTAQPTASSTDTASRTATPTDSPTETSGASPSDSPSASPTGSATETSTPQSTGPPTDTPMASLTASVSPTSTLSASPTETSGATLTDSPSATPTSSATGTPSATGTGSITPNSSATPTLSGTATPSVSPTTAAEAGPGGLNGPGQSGPNTILRVLPEPNPNPRTLYIEMAGDADEVDLSIYTDALVSVADAHQNSVPAGWVQFPLPPDFIRDAANGVYFCRLQSFRAGSKASKPVLAKLMVLR